MTDFADELGSGYMNLVVRRFGQRLSSEGDRYMRRCGLQVSARSTAILSYVSRYDGVSIAAIAQALGYSHQAVAKAIAHLAGMELVRSATSKGDLREREVTLTRQGLKELDKIEAVAADFAVVVEELSEETGVDLFRALRDYEAALEKRSLLGRLIEQGETSRFRQRKAKASK